MSKKQSAHDQLNNLQPVNAMLLAPSDNGKREMIKKLKRYNERQARLEELHTERHANTAKERNGT